MRWSLIASCKNWQNRQLCIPLQNGLSSACVSVYLQRCALKTEMWYRQAQAGPVYLSALCYRVHWPLIWLLMSVLFLEMLCVAFSWNSTFQYWIHTLCKQFRHMLLSGIIFFFYSFSLFPVTVFQLPSHSFLSQKYHYLCVESLFLFDEWQGKLKYWCCHLLRLPSRSFTAVKILVVICNLKMGYFWFRRVHGSSSMKVPIQARVRPLLDMGKYEIHQV